MNPIKRHIYDLSGSIKTATLYATEIFADGRRSNLKLVKLGMMAWV